MDRFKALLADFSSALADPLWTQESEYLIDDLHHAIKEQEIFAEKSLRVQERTVVAELEWSGNGTSLHDVSRDFWKLYGGFSESETFVSREIKTDTIDFYIVTGDSQTKSAHGHIVLIHLVGSKIQRVVESYIKNRKEIRESIQTN